MQSILSYAIEITVLPIVLIKPTILRRRVFSVTGFGLFLDILWY